MDYMRMMWCAGVGHALYARNPLEFCSANMVNSIINLYRAEVQTMTQYRIRLDTSTNWGVSLTAALTAFQPLY